MTTWGKLSPNDRAEALKRFICGESYADLHRRFGIDKNSRENFERKLREGRMWAEILRDKEQIAATQDIDLEKVAKSIKNKPKKLKEQNYHIIETADKVVLDTKTVPLLSPTALDLDSMAITLAVASDLHCGSKSQQITNLLRFEQYVVNQGAQVIIHPGDIFAGLNVYKGQLNDLVAPSADEQRRIAEKMLTPFNGVRRLVLGGNHDFSFIKATGHDLVKALCRSREDMVYLGYDMADIALTDHCTIRVWHPSGGVPYAVSYRLQKGMEQAAYEELAQAIEREKSPNLRMVLSGHLHVECELSRGPVTGAQCGCFEGRTNYLRSKGLYPQIGGAIWRLWLTDNGMIQRKQYEFVTMSEIENDWEQYSDWLRDENSEPETLFSWRASDGDH